MPMNWTPEADAKLFTEILLKFDLKFSKEILASLAEAMGPDCTPKAITEHVRIIKNRVKSGVTSNPATPRKVAKSTPSRGKKSTSKSKGTSAIDNSPSDDEELPTTPKTAKAGTKRGRSTASLSPLLDEIKVGVCSDEDNYESGNVKRVKAEGTDAFTP